MTTKRTLRLLAILFGFVLFAAACGDDDSTTDASDSGDMADEGGDYLVDLEGRTITIAIENAYLPFNYIDAETGEPGGWDYAAIDNICERLNCVPDYRTFDWDPMIQSIADGEFDLAADGITITAERSKIVAFSDGYINIDQRVMVAADSDIDGPDALAAADCTVASVGGTTNYDTAVDLVGEDRIVLFDEFGFVVQAVIVGDACAAIIDETAGQGYIGENADKIQLVGDSLSADELGFIFPLDSDLVEPFNLAIAAMKEDGTMAALGEEFFSGAFTITYVSIRRPH
jgi:polar amino acid transport system substrate-binding protein